MPVDLVEGQHNKRDGQRYQPGAIHKLGRRQDDKDNAGGGERIGTLEEGKFNKATVVIQ